MSFQGPNRTEYYDHCFGHLPSTGQDLKPETLLFEPIFYGCDGQTRPLIRRLEEAKA